MDFEIVQVLMSLSLLGANWVLWLLIGLSILSLGIILERSLFFYKLKSNFPEFTVHLSELLLAGDVKKAREYCEKTGSLEAKVALLGLNNVEKGTEAMSSSMEGFAFGEKSKLDRGLVVLGTLGNNAPFIGLFGTVIGIIKAFHDLSFNPDGGPSVVMGSISEALIATAVGLLVAIPAVIAFNTFGRSVKKHMNHVHSIMKVVLSHQKNQS